MEHISQKESAPFSGRLYVAVIERLATPELYTALFRCYIVTETDMLSSAYLDAESDFPAGYIECRGYLRFVFGFLGGRRR